MSASERLRALHADGERYSSESGMPGLKYLNSHHDLLPLIADVVEAAETYHAAPSDNYRLTDEESEEEEAAYQTLGAALTALQEHLEGGGA